MCCRFIALIVDWVSTEAYINSCCCLFLKGVVGNFSPKD